jgi:CMP-N,N'-diacetyllegionaminic acid synthase
MANNTNQKMGGVLALIPARAGSKSIPRKNVREVAGVPLIVHSIRHAQASQRITRIVVTTDGQEIADVASAAGAEVPFFRPAEFSQDLSPDLDFVRHALEWLRDNEGYVPDMVVQLRPTTPLRDVRLIDKAIDDFAANPAADSLRAVVGACFTPYKMWLRRDDGFLQPLMSLPDIPEQYNEARQRLPEVFQQDGFIDIVRPRTVFEQNSLTGRNIMPFFIANESIDIDYEHELGEATQIIDRKE